MSEENIEQVVPPKLTKKRYPLIDAAVRKAIMEAQYENFLKEQTQTKHENVGP